MLITCSKLGGSTAPFSFKLQEKPNAEISILYEMGITLREKPNADISIWYEMGIT